ncbi:PREDICTED: zinc finger CCHC domain-containing protein 4 isoform X2 [Dipodomys ordii]|uniref:Zinc finger CCHC domain-containing protein 4 isoform X2 n=1 Tax=Dipodomys ordii TaxID=10020 RepID=A0A1S3EME5_DIPOR|nr:PREDICTED: zinc finger CCHC domain-containing protein 4 isoform X2 [Dipodomys ordii]
MAASRGGLETEAADGSSGCSGSSGVEVVFPSGPAAPAPLCPHGPTLLFVKVNQGKEETRRFYACSACRDRKDCSFFQWEDEKLSEARLAAREAYNQSCQPPLSRIQCVERLLRFVQLPLPQRKFCRRCQQLLLPDDWGEHGEHELLGEVSMAQLQRPSQLLHPLENKKTNAQYLFADRTCHFLVHLLSTLGFRRVLCVGTPRLHELIRLTAADDKKYDIKSLLLDIDSRYSQFYMEDSFCHYNMFNHHFFDGKVDYDNHALYKHGKTGRKQSPVRIFTNIPLHKVILPTEEGYRFCPLCQRYVSLENQHCEHCNSCTSKDGRKWKHCFLCRKCVKPSWIHCSICGHCAVADHSCAGPRAGCFICGNSDHKRSTCPNTCLSRGANKAVRKQKQRKSNKMKMEATKGQSMNQTSVIRRKKRRERVHQYLCS